MGTLTCQIVFNRHRFAMSDVRKDASRKRNGDISDVYDTTRWATLDGTNWKWNRTIMSQHSAFIHIIGIPGNLMRSVAERLREPHQLVDEIFRARRFRFLPSAMPIAMRDALTADKEFTIDWTQALDLVRKKLVTDPLDQSTDDESTKIRRSDF